MLVLLVAHPRDPWRPVLAATAASAGHRVLAVDGFLGLDVELRVDRAGRSRTVLRTTDGEDVGGAVHRGGVWTDGLDPFLGAERVAAWWALLAGFVGPVVNRPTRHGLLCTIDRLRTRRTPGTWPGGALLRDVWAGGPGAGSALVVRTAARHRPVATSPGRRSAHLRATDEVLDVTRCAPARVVRVAVAGAATFALGAGDAPTALPEPFAGRLRGLLAPDLPLLATLVVELADDASVRVLDIDPLPHPRTLGASVRDAAVAVIGAATTPVTEAVA
jgi:hypothetical protein